MTASAPTPAPTTSPRFPPTARAPGLPLWLRISATVLGSFLLAALVAGAWIGVAVVQLAEQELEDSLAADIEMLVPAVRRGLTTNDTELLQSIAGGATARGMVRLTVILPDGEVVAESEHRLPIPSHRDRPEVQDALRDGRGRAERKSTTTSDVYVYVAQRVDGADGRPVGILRIARPKRLVQAFDHDVIRTMGVAALFGLPVAALVGWLAARRIARPLEEMTAAATRMAAGDFTHVPHSPGVGEAGRLGSALERMGRELSEMLRSREQSRAELAAILDSMAEGVLAIDRDERVLLANRAVAECLGISAAPAPGSLLREVVRLPEISTQLRRALGGRLAPEIDVTLPGAAGRVLAVGATPIGVAGAPGDDGARGAVLVLRDVTVVRRLERTRLDFVANVSHELRTPLAAVLGSVETVRDLGDEEPEARARMLETAARQGRRLAAIVDDLLALSKIETEGDQLERGPVPLLRGLRSAASAVAADAKARGVTLSLPSPEAADTIVLGNEGRLEQVWTNLLANAVKYNRPEGSVTVTVSVDTARRAADVSVADTGQGIPAEHLPRIFERFYRVDKGRSRDQGGTGLGLAIVKHIVVAHRGSVHVESRPGEGSVFRIRLPLAEAEPTDRPRGAVS
ncbi:MAG: HAMP domain-containing protein [Planctomycetes bacterium]|nr:HAMP domain-containing protein [Planctomycetota bacterium]